MQKPEIRTVLTRDGKSDQTVNQLQLEIRTEIDFDGLNLICFRI
jgi:hypothetical protein